MTNLLNVCTYNIPTTFNRYPVTDRGNVEWVTRIVMFVNLSFILDYLLPLSDKYTYPITNYALTLPWGN